MLFLLLTDINECASDPCIHGNCTDVVNGYICSCELGYEGTHCDVGKYDIGGT